MRLFLVFILWASAFISLSSLTAPIAGLTLNIDSKPQEKGEVLVAVFPSAKGFPYDATKAVKLAKCKPVSGKCTLVFNDLPAGRYAVSVFQDRNGDEKFNTNFLGIPQEGYGVSNNAISAFRAPTFEEAAFQYNSSSTLSIRLTY